MFRQTWIGALRGGLGFLGGALLLLAYLYMSSKSNPAGEGSLCGSLLAIFASGAVGGAVLAWGTDEPVVTLRIAAGFGAGAVVTMFMLMFVFLSLQGGGRPDITWGAVGSGIAFAAGGGVGGFLVGPRYALWGALAFGVPGAMMGGSIFFLQGVTTSTWLINCIGISSVVGLPTIGGAVFGAIVGAYGEG